MTITMYDLAGAEDARRFSPYCWRIKMAMAHKDLDVETIPWRFTEKDRLPAGTKTVPTLIDGDTVIGDSWEIADYLDRKYPDRPLLQGKSERGLAKFLTAWTESVVHPALTRIVVLDIYKHIAEKDREYFRTSREARVGKTLEAFTADTEANVAAFQKTVHPLRITLRMQDYLGGDAPNYGDYVAFGAFMWARSISPVRLLAADDTIAAWRSRLLAAFDGLAGKALGYPV
ncbi:MAG: Glutathione S-transferase domain [Rhodospirillales bacterium]|jgi:glutathione S-transferase|nr:Glutathione S-transferase domain [Rhodospirillales bacterium]